MADTETHPDYLVEIVAPEFLGNVTELDLLNFTVMEITLGESLHTPGLQTTIRVQSSIHDIGKALNGPTQIKNIDNFKGAGVFLRLIRKANSDFGVASEMNVIQTVYRIEKRHLYNNNTEEFLIHACDPTLLEDAKRLVSKMWNCETPSNVVRQTLTQCVGAKNLKIENSFPGRPYVANNIHPFQVVYQQANVALAAGNDPSFVHFMTYNIQSGEGIHNFRSLYTMARQTPINNDRPFQFNETSTSFTSPPQTILSYSFPCDFDLVTDLLNGPGSIIVVNPAIGSSSLLGSQIIGCGLGEGPLKTSLTNTNSSTEQNMCPDYAQTIVQKRQARMRLIDPNHIGMRITLPFNPSVHAGDVVKVELKNKNDPTVLNYGSGVYLVVSMKHNVKMGGYGTTTLDCVNDSVKSGIV